MHLSSSGYADVQQIENKRSNYMILKWAIYYNVLLPLSTVICVPSLRNELQPIDNSTFYDKVWTDLIFGRCCTIAVGSKAQQG